MYNKNPELEQSLQTLTLESAEPALQNLTLDWTKHLHLVHTWTTPSIDPRPGPGPSLGPVWKRILDRVFNNNQFGHFIPEWPFI